MAMYKCEMGHLWKQSDGDICPDCPKLTCDVCSYVWYTRQSNMCPRCPKWVCAECKHRWYKRDGDRCPKCLPKWTCAECKHQWYKKDGDECPKCPINLSLNAIKQKFNEITEKNDAIQYFESELAANISQLFTDGIKDYEKQEKDVQIDEKDEIPYDTHLKLGIICHSVEEYITCLDHVQKALKIKPDFNDTMTTFEEYGYVEYKQSKGYIENEIEEIIKNGTNNIKIFDEDEKQEEQKYDDEFFQTNLPYHYCHNFKQKKFEESKIYTKCSSYRVGWYNDCYNMELDLARRVCGEPELQQYINKFVYFRIVDAKQINETILRTIMDINDDEHIKKIFERLQNHVRDDDNVNGEIEKKVDDIAEEMKKYNKNISEIHNRSYQVEQLIVILQNEISEITGRGKKLKNQRAINDFINEMQSDKDKIQQLLVSMKTNKYFEKLGELRSFIELIKDIKSITLIDEDDDLYKLFKNKSWSKICNVYSQSYLYHITYETKKHLKCVLQSFGFLNYVTEKKMQQYVESLKKAKDCGFDKETQHYFDLIETQTKLRNEITLKHSSFLSMTDKFASILKEQYYRDRLSMENEMKNVQSNTIQSKLTLWSVQHEKRKQQQENVKDHMKRKYGMSYWCYITR